MRQRQSMYIPLAALVFVLSTIHAAAQCCAPQSAIDACTLGSGGRCQWNYTSCGCVCSSPIIIDVDGHGFHLTSAENGVSFDMIGDGSREQIAWTSRGSTNAFLVLDRNGNGIIDNGTELFGDHTPQPKSDHPNGFLALAQYDRAENGGNEDGKIDRQDAIFKDLRLWIDSNHDGISQQSEMFRLPSLNIHSLPLSCRSQLRDIEASP